MVFQIISSLIQSAISLAVLFTLLGPKLWHYSGTLLTTPSETYQSLIFCGGKMLLDTAIEIPFSLYSDFVLEEKHGFNQKTIGLFIKDLFLSLMLQVVIGGPVLSTLIFLVRWGGDLFYIYVFAFVVVFYFVMMIVYPEVIAPLFNKYEPLQDGELKEGIEAVARRLKFPLREIKQIDGSKRSSHSNMYFYGLWRFKKIVVYDTLLKQPTSQIIAITMHELGHWNYMHTARLMFFNFSHIFAIFYLFKMFKDDASMFESFGYSKVDAFVIGITLFSCLYTPIGVLMHIICNTITRSGEYQADNFAVIMGHGEELAKGLIEVHHNNKSMIHHDSLYSWFHFTHPVLFERIYAIYKAIHDKKI